MKDKIFGELSFHVGWTKQEELLFDGKTYMVRLRTFSLKDELPTENQQNAYLQYKANVPQLFERVDGQIRSFIESHIDQIEEQFGVRHIENYSSVLSPFEVLFLKNGKYALLFNTRWSEDEMCILCDGDDVKVDEGYILEFEY